MEDHYPCKDIPTSIVNLPEELLHLIFEGLKSSDERESFGLTCHRWLQIQNSHRRSLQFHCALSSIYLVPLSHDSPKIQPFHLHRLLTRFQGLSSLSLSGCTELPDSGLAPLQNFGSNLRTLYLDCCFGITDEGFSLLACACPSLTSISLYRCNITDTGLDALAESCSSLHNVKLSYCSLISDLGIRSMSQKCRQLRQVTISYCRNLTGIGFRGCSETLYYLEADSCKLAPEGLQAIVSGGGLEYLDISCLSWYFLGDGLSAIGEGLATKLRVLNMRMCRFASDQAIITIAKGCPVLQEWNLAVCHEVSLDGWEAIGLNCHNLEILHLNRCRNLCDLGLQALREGCNRLSILYMVRCGRVTQLGVEMFKFLRGNVEIREEEIARISFADENGRYLT